MIILSIALLLLLGINVAAYLVYRLDKQRARHHQWRIPENTLLLLAALGGAPGALLAMLRFHHKTKKKKFLLCVPIFLMLQLAVILLLAGASYLLEYSLNPAGRQQKDADSMNYLRQYPHAAEWVDSMQQAGALRDTFIVNDHGRRLHALYAPCRQAKGTVVLVHGYTDCALRMMMLGQVYHDSLHFNILAPDHERHGQSEGDVIQMGWLDRLNTERWIDVATQLWPRNLVYLHGISMGAATVMMCSGDQLPPAVRGIIEDCGYTSVWDEFAGELQNQFRLPIHPLLDVASLLCQVRYGWNFRQASALDQVRRSTLPMLFIHGDSDDFVPTQMVYQLHGAKTHGYKQLWLAPGSGHAASFRDHPREYLEQVREFIEAINNPVSTSK